MGRPRCLPWGRGDAQEAAVGYTAHFVDLLFHLSYRKNNSNKIVITHYKNSCYYITISEYTTKYGQALIRTVITVVNRVLHLGAVIQPRFLMSCETGAMSPSCAHVNHLLYELPCGVSSWTNSRLRFTVTACHLGVCQTWQKSPEQTPNSDADWVSDLHKIYLTLKSEFCKH